MSEVHNPHDGFCKRVFGHTDLAVKFLQHFLPRDALAGLDLSRLTPLPGEFVDEELANHQSDLLFSVPELGGDETLVYVLIEHKSQPDRQTPLQLLRYMARVWDVCCASKKQFPYSPILPVIICQGNRAWPWPAQFQELVRRVPGMAPYTPHFSIHLVDLFRVDDAELPDDPQLGSVLLVMKHIQRARLSQAILEQAAFFLGLFLSPGGIALFELILNYISAVLPQEKREPVWKALQQATAPQGEHTMRTIADSFREEGREIGLAEGIDLGRAEGIDLGIAKGGRKVAADIIIEDLEERFGDVPQNLVERIRSQPDLSTLMAMRRALRKADSIEDCVRLLTRAAWN